MIGTTLLHYRILEQLGEGGMGEVWLAEDTRLSRRVAIKVLPAKVANDKERRARLEREARSVAALNHPNVVTLYALEEDAGVLFLVMEHVAGTMLTDAIPDEGFELREFFDVAMQIADGVAAAHQQGIVHRDLKPDNVIISDGGTLRVLDFGVAKWEAAEPSSQTDISDAPTRALTRTGAAVGTVPYMSPEQLKSEVPGPASDVFSLGSTFFEMLTGRRPFLGANSAELITAILRDEPPDLHALRNDLPDHLVRIISRCLDKEPRRRYDNAKQVRDELASLKREARDAAMRISRGPTAPRPPPQPARQREPRSNRPTVSEPSTESPGPVGRLARGAVALLLVVLLVGASYVVWGRLIAPGDERKILVVLPLENVGTAEEAEFAQALSTEVRTRLSGIDGLGVISRHSSRQYQGGEWTLAQLIEELGADFVLLGTVIATSTEDGVRGVRVMPELIETGEETTLWSPRIERDDDDLFEIEGEIASGVREALRAFLPDSWDSGADTQRVGTDNEEAYEAYLRGQQQGWGEGEPDFVRATVLDPKYAEAWARLAMTQAAVYQSGHERTEAQRAEAKRSLQRAQSLAPGSADSEIAAASVAYMVEHDHPKALAALQRAEKIRPSDEEISTLRGAILRRAGRWSEAEAATTEAIELDPRNPGKLRALAEIQILRENYDEAMNSINRALRLGPGLVQSVERKTDIIFHQQGLTAANQYFEGTRFQPHGQPPFCFQFERLLAARRFEEVLETATALELEEDRCGRSFHLTPRALMQARALVGLERPDDAREAFRRARQWIETKMITSPKDPRLFAALGYIDAHLDDRESAITNANKAVELSPVSEDAMEAPVLRWSRALVYAILDDQDRALDELEEVFRMERLFSPRELLVHPDLAGLAGKSRLAALVKDLPGRE